MNQKKSITIILVLGITAILIAVILCAIFIPLPTASEIYQDCLKSIVELRASSDNVGESFGTAEFIDKNGTLITNAHVVTVELVKYDVEIDIAVLRICESSSCKFNVIKKGKSSNLKSGDKVYAIGNTVNYGLSISQGIVGIPLLNIEYSGAVRTVIQCDLTIADGNSGGALLDSRGRLVGITTFRTKDRLGNIVYGIAYCIPIDIVMGFVEE